MTGRAFEFLCAAAISVLLLGGGIATAQGASGRPHVSATAGENANLSPGGGPLRSVNYIGKVDPRRELTDIPELTDMHFGQAEIERVRACSGIIICPKDGSHPHGWGSATSLESSDQVVTAVHILFNGFNSTHPTLKHNLGLCHFQNYLDPDDHISFKYDNKEKDDWSRRNFNSDVFQQSAVIRLERKIPHCDPFPVDRSDRPMPTGEAVVSVGHATPNMVQQVSGKEPIGEICEIEERTGRAGIGSVYKSNCSAEPGQSGSPLFVLRKNGDGQLRWMAKAILVTSGPESLDGQPFNLATGSFTTFLGIEGRFLREVLRGAGAHGSTIEPHATERNAAGHNSSMKKFFQRFGAGHAE